MSVHELMHRSELVLLSPQFRNICTCAFSSRSCTNLSIKITRKCCFQIQREWLIQAITLMTLIFSPLWYTRETSSDREHIPACCSRKTSAFGTIARTPWLRWCRQADNKELQLARVPLVSVEVLCLGVYEDGQLDGQAVHQAVERGPAMCRL
jgi:hypothetical protein